ncbi:MAG: heme o synthase [Mycobacteriales bacterium]|jgi:heme o synthase
MSVVAADQQVSTGAGAAAPERPVAVAAPRGRVRDVLLAYVGLTKPRIIELLLVTTVPTMMVAAGGMPSAWVMIVTLVGGTLAAGSANALNCYVDRDIDEVMRRTRRRPLPRHSVSPKQALVFGILLGVVSVDLFAVATNLLAAGLTAAAILFYVFVYTLWLKRRTPQAVVWGGVAGCMQILIGWAAVTGGLDWPALALFGVLFCWQPPHFWALAIRYREDYAAAKVPMLPVVASERVVARDIVAWAVLTVGCSLLLWNLGWGYLVAAAVLGAVFLRESWLLYGQARAGRPLRPMRLFHLSNSYLALLFCAVAASALLS